MPRFVHVVIAMALLGCQGDPTPSSGDVDSLLRSLPPWAEFAPPLDDVAPMPIDGGTPETFEVSGDAQTITDEDGDGDGIADVEVVEDVVSRCTSVPWTMTQTPERIVMYSPDVELLWPGALLQGRSHRDGLGSLDALPIAERSPLEVSIPAISSGENFRVVEQPTQARVAGAIGEIVGDAVAADLVTPSTITFEEKTYYSESEFALSLSMSGRYLGFEGSASGSVEGSAARNTVTAQFFQKMFEVVVAPPATPAGLFTDAFTEERYREQESLGRIGPDNLPVYVSNVVYGRMMTFSLTSTASESEIRATMSAAYDGLVASAEVELDARQRAILAESTIAVSSLGGDAEATIAMIRSGNWQEYFTADAPLSSATPLSYTFRNLGDNSIATASEATEYSITTCAARAEGDVFDFVELEEHEAPIDPPFTVHAGDFDGDGFDDVLWNHRSAEENTFYVGYGGPDGRLQLAEPFTHPGAPTGVWGDYELLVGDVDDDERDDLVWSRLDSSNTWHVARFDGRDAVAFDPEDRYPAGGWGTYGATLGDVDGDGRDDLHFVQRSATLNPRAYAVVDYTPEAGFATLPARDLEPAYPVVPVGQTAIGPLDVALADLDGDGDDDLVARRIVRAGIANVAGAWLDYELVWWALSNRGTSLHDAPTVRQVAVGAAGTVVSHDLLVGPFAGGAADELAMIGRAPAFDGPRVSLWSDDGGSSAYTGPDVDDYAGFTALGADIDGDGRHDVVWSRRDGAVNETLVGFGRADGMDLDGAVQRHPWPVPDWDAFEAPLALDVNGDGRDDLVWIQAGPIVRVSVGLASGTL